jgi:hypothetical protein
LAGSVADAFNPLQSSTLLQAISPTATDPFVQVAENKTWFGGNLMPPKNPFEKVPKPDSERYFNSAREPSKWIAKTLNKVTNGNSVRKGMVDISPETLDLVFDTFTGGAGRFYIDLLGMPQKYESGSLEVKNVPGVRRLYGTKSKYKVGSDYRKNREHVLILDKEAKAYPDDKTIKEDKTFILISQVKQADRNIRKLYKLKKNAKTKQAKDNIQKQIDHIQKLFNIKFNRLRRAS